MTKKKCPVLKYEIESISRGIVITAFSSNVPVGYAVAQRKTLRGRKLLIVGFIEVTKKLRHCGIGTSLYKQLATEACNRKSYLASDENRSWLSDKFWQKQVTNGRAYCAKFSKKEPNDGKEDYSLGRNNCAYYVFRKSCSKPI